MTKILLLASNHLRDQRWVLMTMFAYAIIMSSVFGFFAGPPSAEDARFFIEQQLWFAVLFSVFLATAAVNTDMRTRRILAILSKSIARWQYLLGVITGIGAAICTYCIVVGFAGSMISLRAGHPYDGLWTLAAEIALAAVTVACVGLLFGVVMSPLFATAATFAYLTLVPFLALRVWPGFIVASPVTFILAQTGDSMHAAPPMPIAKVLVLTCVQAAVFFGLAILVFSKRDLARPTE